MTSCRWSREVAEAADLIGRYAELKIGLADASVAVIAATAKTTRLLTLDERHFRPSAHSGVRRSPCCQPIRRDGASLIRAGLCWPATIGDPAKGMA